LKCRHCRAELATTFLDLGTAPPSNAYLSANQLRAPETWYPLRLLVCERCWLVQTEDHTERDALFTEDYAYFSSFSSSWLEHSRRYVDAMRQRFSLDRSSMVAEVAANDGYLLQYVQQAGIPCYGIEPTASTAAAARVKGLHIVERFFGVELAEELVAQGQQADLVAANNVLAHVPDVNDFAAGFARLLKPQGVATFEFPHLMCMVEMNQFDTAYHEHYSYLSLGVVRRLFATAGLQVFDVEELGTHGGSLRVYAQRADSGTHPVAPAVAALLGREEAAGMGQADYYRGFQLRAERVKDALLRYLLDAKAAGRRIAAYGAAAKGNTLLNFAGVRPDLVAFVADRNPAKQSLYMPGSRIPIVGEEWLREARPHEILLLPWNLKPELLAQLAYARDWGARFVTAVPTLELA
jgi:SAM-dependent methyltransferase